MNSEKEIWKPIPGFEESHEVSNYGVVRSLNRKVWVDAKDDGWYKMPAHYRTYKSKTLSPWRNNDGLMAVKIVRKGVNKFFVLRKLVKQVFGEESRYEEPVKKMSDAA